MSAGRKTHTFIMNETAPLYPNLNVNTVCGRNLSKGELGGVIFGCKNNTIKECLSKQIFGLPTQHFSYVKNIDPGLPLFLFNYSDRKLHGIFEAAGHGQMNINPYGWTTDGSERTPYPAQVQIRVRLKCHPLPEDRFRPIIAKNYYGDSHNHFWFELDHVQTSKLMSLLVALAISPGTSVPQYTTLIFLTTQASKSDSTDLASSFDGDNQPLDSQLDLKAVEQDEKHLIFMKLKELALKNGSQDVSSGNVDDTVLLNDINFEGKSYSAASAGFEENKEASPYSSSECQSIISQLLQEVEELKAFRTRQMQMNSHMEQKLEEAKMEVRQLKDRCMMLESVSNLSVTPADEIVTYDELHVDPKESLFLIGGFDGESWLSSMDLYSPSQDIIKSLNPMSSVRAYSSAVQLGGELYVFGGGNGFVWYDTVESYSPMNNQWTSCPSLNEKKGSLAGAALNNKIFVMGGGNGIASFSDVEMLDFDIGRWISVRSMLQKRFALATIELNGVLYAAGGYDGHDYLMSAERFDPREHSWMKIANMKTKRGCHSMAVLNEKLYALGGFDGGEMVSSVEVYDPRLDAWMMGEPMNLPRGYSSAGVINESIYVVGGVKFGDNIVDTVEAYKEGEGWQETRTNAVGKRCFMSAVVL
ncbi:Kelch-like protein [Quillaja saponaria]|uniref:Kelch-like protein n=1 Tax=Quillaja saponaria TaxID=32244 RepID=A0AAD7L391_QUISA|nr:Kelch-like protein [Quillaja saponaria]